MKTLALNMMVGPNDVDLAIRSFESFEVLKNFDEIIIGLTLNDNTMIEKLRAALEGKGQVLPIQFIYPDAPHGSFSAARNTLIKATTSDYIMWLDSDDITNQVSRDTFSKLRDCISKNNFNYYLLKYDLQDGRILYRDRIFKNDGIQWKYHCHEQLIYSHDATHASIEGVTVFHAPLKPAEFSVSRNLQILEQAYADNQKDPFYKIHLAKELFALSKFGVMEESKINQAIMLSSDIIFKHEASSEVLYHLCLEMTQCLETSAPIISETFLYMAAGFLPEMAEPYTLLGELYQSREDYVNAIRFFKQVIGMKVSKSTQIHQTCYTERPLIGLSLSYEAKGEIELALYWSKKLVEINKSFEIDRQRLIQQLK